MHLILPPSEGKRVPARGKPMDLETLSWPELTPTRSRVLAALAETSGRADALQALGVGAALADDVARNTRLDQIPSAPAETVFTGVLFAALGLATMTPPARTRARRRCVVMTAAYGPVRLPDRIAPYRLAMGARLVPGRPLAALWRQSAGPLLDASTRRGLVVDLSSTDYLAAWRPADSARWVAVTVVGASHSAKHTRGLVARALAEEPGRPTRPQELLDIVRSRVEATLREPVSTRSPWVLEVTPPVG